MHTRICIGKIMLKWIIFILLILVVLLSLSCCTPEKGNIGNDSSVLTKRIDAEKLKKIYKDSKNKANFVSAIRVYDGIIFNTYNGVYKYSTEDASCKLIPNSEEIISIIEDNGTIYFIQQKRSNDDFRSNLFSIFRLSANNELTEVFDSYELQVEKTRLDTSDVDIKGNYIFIQDYNFRISVFDYDSNQIIYKLQVPRDYSFTADNRVLYTEHHGNGNLIEYNPETGQEKVLRGVGLYADPERPIKRYIDHVFCHKNEIYYSTFSPWALWRYNEEGEDICILQDNSVASAYLCYECGSYMYILQYSRDLEIDKIVIYRYNYKSREIEEQWDFSDIGCVLGNNENFNIIDNVFVYRQGDKVYFKDIPVN